MIKNKITKATVPEPSKSGSLNKQDLMKIFKGALIAISGALLTYAAELIPGLDFGEYTLIVAPLLSVLVNTGLKWYEGQPKN